MLNRFSQISATAALALVCAAGLALGGCGDDPVETPTDNNLDLGFSDSTDEPDASDELDQTDEEAIDASDGTDDQSSDSTDQSETEVDIEEDLDEDRGDDSVETDADLIDSDDLSDDRDTFADSDGDPTIDAVDSADDVQPDVPDDTSITDAADTIVPVGNVYLGFGELVEEFRTSTLEITIRNPQSVGGFKFSLPGLDFDDHEPVSGGRADDEGFRFSVDYESGQILGYRGAEPAILNPEPLGVLLIIKYKNPVEIDELCFEDVVINDKEGEIIDSETGPCLCFVEVCE